MKRKSVRPVGVLNQKVEKLLRNMKSGKSPSPDNITIEILEPIERIRMSVLTKFLNELYNNRHIQPDLSGQYL